MIHTKEDIFLSIVARNTIVNVLCAVAVLNASFAWTKERPIEIEVNGVKYSSVAAYKAALREQPREIIIDSQEHELRQATRALGLDFDPDKVKTVRIGGLQNTPHESVPPDPGIETLKAISVEEPFAHVITDFNQTWERPTPGLTISSRELEERLKAVAGGRKEPVLVISGPKKLRVLTLEEKGRRPQEK